MIKSARQIAPEVHAIFLKDSSVCDTGVLF